MLQGLNVEILYKDTVLASAFYFYSEFYNSALEVLGTILDSLKLEKYKEIPTRNLELKQYAVDLLKETNAILDDDLEINIPSIPRDNAGSTIQVDISKGVVTLINLIKDTPLDNYKYINNEVVKINSNNKSSKIKCIYKVVDFNPLEPITFNKCWELFDHDVYNLIDFIIYKEKVYQTNKYKDQ